jgi:hypothetical protein
VRLTNESSDEAKAIPRGAKKLLSRTKRWLIASLTLPVVRGAGAVALLGSSFGREGVIGRSRLLWVCALTLGVVALVGCQDVVESKTYRFQVAESLPGSPNPPGVGFEICQADTENCEKTDAAGRAELDVPANQEVAFTFENEGFGPFIVGDVSDDTFGPECVGDGRVTVWEMFPIDQEAAIARQLQTPYPWEGGIVGLARWVFPNTGVTFAAVGSTIDAVGEPFYFDAETKQYTLDLEATTYFPGTDGLPLSQGGFTEVKAIPGEQQFEFGGTAGDCHCASWAWPVEGAPNRIRVPVREGYRTYGSMVCDDP